MPVRAIAALRFHSIPFVLLLLIRLSGMNCRSVVAIYSANFAGKEVVNGNAAIVRTVKLIKTVRN